MSRGAGAGWCAWVPYQQGRHAEAGAGRCRGQVPAARAEAGPRSWPSLPQPGRRCRRNPSRADAQAGRRPSDGHVMSRVRARHRELAAQHGNAPTSRGHSAPGRQKGRAAPARGEEPGAKQDVQHHRSPAARRRPGSWTREWPCPTVAAEAGRRPLDRRGSVSAGISTPSRSATTGSAVAPIVRRPYKRASVPRWGDLDGCCRGRRPAARVHTEVMAAERVMSGAEISTETSAARRMASSERSHARAAMSGWPAAHRAAAARAADQRVRS